MPQIHISTPDGDQAVYTDEQVRELWQQGRLTGAASYWQDGMTEWRSLDEYLGGTPTAEPPAPTLILNISTPDGEQTTMTEDRARELWQQGQIPAGASYWREGMPDWRPLHEYLGPSPAAHRPQFPGAGFPANISPIPQATGGLYTFARDPGLLTGILLVTFGVFLLCNLIGFGSEWLQLRLTHLGTITPEAAAANDLRQGMIAIVHLIIFIANAIIFFCWIRQANINSRGFGAEGMEFTPGWSIGWFFIPFANLVQPYKVMKEIWQISLDPADWRNQRGSALIGLWWGLWLACGLTGQVEAVLAKQVTSPESLRVATIAMLAGSLAKIAVTIVVAVLVHSIHRQQKALVARVE